MTPVTIRTQNPTTWPLKCPQCGDRIQVELPPGTEEGRTGEVRCRRGHPLVFGFDGVTVRLLEFVGEER
jgi:hypothetical protein